MKMTTVQSMSAADAADLGYKAGRYDGRKNVEMLARLSRRNRRAYEAAFIKGTLSVAPPEVLK